ncbi:MAG: UTP--glucose-1-phosphate uridylyltransferase [Mycoplasmoidaceae bacterium]
MIKKAVIPAAGFGTRFLPFTKSVAKELLPIIDKPAIDYIVNEAMSAGIEEIAIIINPKKDSIINYFSQNVLLEDFLTKNGKKELLNQIKNNNSGIKIRYIIQSEPLGLGHAIYCAKDFVGNEPFAVLLPDDLIFTNNSNISGIGQCIEKFNETKSSVLGVQEVKDEDVHKYGIIKSNNYNNLILVDNIIEKPTLKNAPSNMAIIGRYIFTPKIFCCIERTTSDKNNEIEISNSINLLLEKEKVYGKIIIGERHDTGNKLGYIKCLISEAYKDIRFKKEVEIIIKNLINYK